MGLLDRLRRRARPPADPTLRKVPDDLPRGNLLAAPLVVERLESRPSERLPDGRVRVTFRARVRDAEGKPCPDVAVDATLRGPERTATGQGTTDLMGRIRFRMTGGHGVYSITIDDVAAGGLAWDATAGPTTATVDVD